MNSKSAAPSIEAGGWVCKTRRRNAMKTVRFRQHVCECVQNSQAQHNANRKSKTTEDPFLHYRRRLKRPNAHLCLEHR
jgi:hypothetical protein